MGDFTNITLDGKPLVNFLLDQQRREIEMHIASEVAELRRGLPRARVRPYRSPGSRRGRKPTEIRPWVVAEIKALSADQSLTIDDIAVRVGQPAKLVRLCLKQEAIRRKPGRKKSVDRTESRGACDPLPLTEKRV